jgi:hypothetical protein
VAAILASSTMNTDRWDAHILRGLLANLRTTGKLGFRGDRIDIAPLEQLGWRHFHDADTINYSPHFESGLMTIVASTRLGAPTNRSRSALPHEARQHATAVLSNTGDLASQGRQRCRAYAPWKRTRDTPGSGDLPRLGESIS